MKLELELHDPLIKCYPNFGNLFSIIDLSEPEVEEWVNWNFLHFLCFHDRFTTPKDQNQVLRECPFLEHSLVHDPNAEFPNTDIVDFVIQCLNEGYYVILRLNWFYIPSSFAYQKYNIDHTTLVSGYDLSSKEFIISDNIKDGLYQRGRYSFDDFRNGFRNLSFKLDWRTTNVMKIRPLEHSYLKTMGMIEPEDKRHYLVKRYRFDIEFFTKQLISFLNPKTLFFDENAAAYNLDAIRYECQYLQEDILLRKESIDRRVFYVYFEHAKLLCSKLDFLVKHKYLEYDAELKKGFSELMNDYQKIVLLALKFNMSKNYNIIPRIICMLEHCIAMEEELIKTLIEHLIAKNTLTIDNYKTK